MLNKNDYASGKTIKWCPGCGDYAILNAIQKAMLNNQIKRENTVFISGIGCSSRLPYYLNTYGFHTIHGRAPTIAAGLKVMRDELDVWVITGDGDGLSIGLSHLLHTIRRNVNIKILLFNNKIYGLTKGQYSPTSEINKVTKSSPYGSIDAPVNPISMALSAGCSFVAREVDVDSKNLETTLESAMSHDGSCMIEILQNCNVFNDKAFFEYTGKDNKQENTVRLVNNKPLIFGSNHDKCLVPDGYSFKSVVADDKSINEFSYKNSLPDNTLAYIMSKIDMPLPLGIFYKEERKTYQHTDSHTKKTPEELFKSAYTWEVG